MATIKLKFRPSSIKGKRGSLFIQVFHHQKTRQITTTYKIYPREWDSNLREIKMPTNNIRRSKALQIINSNIQQDFSKIREIIQGFISEKTKFTSDQVIAKFGNKVKKETLFNFTQISIDRLKQLGKDRTAETYVSTLRSFTRFRNGIDIKIDHIDSDLLQAYESFLKQNGAIPNTISFYMRILRAIYNRAVDNNLAQQHNPFKHVYTGIDKTIKRAIHINQIKMLKSLDLSQNPRMDKTRDLFLFSFYTRGMSFIDMAFLRKKDLSNGILTYRRRKTNQRLHIKWEECMQEIIQKYENTNSPYLLPILKGKNLFKNNNIAERKEYHNALTNQNNKLKKLGEMIGVETPLTMYVARHSWASTARSKNIPISVISQGMGHYNELTTQIYLASLDTAVIDNANKMIITLI